MPDMDDANKAWNVATAYEEYMGRWSRLLAPHFVSWLAAPPDAHWLEVGCGTGALTAAICAEARPASVTACDSSASFIAHARKHLVDPRVSFVVAKVGALPKHHGGFGCVTSALALNFFPEPAAAVEEMRKIAAHGGFVSACVWDYAGRMEFLRRFWDAAGAVDPRSAHLDEGRRFPICHPDALAALFHKAGLHDVVWQALEITTRFPDFAALWTPFLGGTGPAPTYLASLNDDQRKALADQLSNSLPREPDGAISLAARAWAVRGVV